MNLRGREGLSPFRDAPVTSVLILSFVAVFMGELYLAAFRGEAAIARLVERYGFTAAAFEGGEYYRLLTHMFLHGSTAHLGSNAAVFYIAGRPVERRVGGLKQAFVFLFSGLAGSLLTYLVLDPVPTSIGASAGVMGVVAVAALLTPLDSMLEGVPVLRYLSLPVLRVAFSVALLAVLVVAQETAMAALQAYSLVESNVGHVAHAGGIIGGAAMAYTLNPGEAVQSAKFSAALLAGLVALFMLPTFTLSWYGAAVGCFILLLYWKTVRDG